MKAVMVRNEFGEMVGVYLVILQGPRIKGPAQEKFSYHTSQGPHIYGFTKWQSQNNLWSPVEKHT